MQPVQHQMMGYDRTSAMYSPDGRLLQVEYAKKAVKQGSAAIGLVCKDGVLLVADRRIIDQLIVASSVEKVLQIDDHVAATSTGYVMDGRVLLERAQLLAQQHRVTYDEPISILELVKEIADIKQLYTQLGGGRPFGVSIMLGGIEDDRAVLFVTDPTGIYFEYKATAIGESETILKEILKRHYRESLTMEEGIKMAIRALRKVLGKEFCIERIDGAYVTKREKQFTKLERSKITKYA